MEALGIFFLITINQLFALISLSSSTAHLPLLNLAACTSCSYINQGMFCYIVSCLYMTSWEAVEFEKSFTKQICLMLSNYQSACLKWPTEESMWCFFGHGSCKKQLKNVNVVPVGWILMKLSHIWKIPGGLQILKNWKHWFWCNNDFINQTTMTKLKHLCWN